MTASALEVLDATAVTLQNHEAPGCPATTVTVNGNTLKLSCNGGRKETLTLHPGGIEGPVLTGRGGFFLPTFHPERWRILASVVPMTPQQDGHAFDLGDVAASLGFKVVTSSLLMRWKYSHEIRLLRLEHPDGRDLWGSVLIEDYADGQVNDALILGGVVVARFRCHATFEDRAIAELSDVELAEEQLPRVHADDLRPHSQPLTVGRLQLVVNAVASGTAHTLAFPELAFRS